MAETKHEGTEEEALLKDLQSLSVQDAAERLVLPKEVQNADQALEWIFSRSELSLAICARVG